ncbi:MAG: hypothetical protein HXY25_01645 [Alphaproteobacteria bacterium]|nr:hypothetical protein [Alphaproteobacteria bacterium]
MTTEIWLLALGGLVWLGIVVALFALVRAWSHLLAFIFLGFGILAPAALVFVPWVAEAIGCADSLIEAGVSEDARLRYRIVATGCRGDRPAFRIDIGRNDDFVVLNTAFRSRGGPTPNSLKQIGPNRFRVYMADPPELAPDPPVILTVDPATARPIEVFSYVNGRRLPETAPVGFGAGLFGREE